MARWKRAIRSAMQKLRQLLLVIADLHNSRKEISMAKKFTQIPEELFEHVLWEKASNDYKMVLITILRHTAFEDQNKANLKKGQCQKSVREIAKEAKTSKSTAEHAIDHFIGLNSHKKVRGDVPAQSRRILERQKERQKVRPEERQKRDKRETIFLGKNKQRMKTKRSSLKKTYVRLGAVEMLITRKRVINIRHSLRNRLSHKRQTSRLRPRLYRRRTRPKNRFSNSSLPVSPRSNSWMDHLSKINPSNNGLLDILTKTCF